MGRLPLIRAIAWCLCSIACSPSGCNRSTPVPVAAPLQFPHAEVALPAATPATEIIVEINSVLVRNVDFVRTWPAADRERASHAAPEGEPRWPMFERRLALRGTEGEAIPELLGVLALARRAERSMSESGGGSSQYNLQVAVDVPWRSLERVLYTAAVAGYRTPRLIFDPADHPRMLAIATGARPAGAPTQEEIARALANVGAPSIAPSTEAPIELRVELRDPRVIVRRGGNEALAPGCQHAGGDPTFVDDPTPQMILRCLRSAGGGSVVLEAPPELPAGRIASVAQWLGGGEPPPFSAIHLTSAR